MRDIEGNVTNKGGVLETHLKVLGFGLEGQVLGLSLKVSTPQK